MTRTLEHRVTEQRIVRGSIPLYFQIERILRNRIRTSAYSPGAALPTEEELIREFGVSRTTIRQALASLQREGLITRHPGRGTYVGRTSPGGFARTFGSFEDILRYADETRYTLLDIERLEAPADVAQALKLPPKARAMRYRGLRSIGDPPFVYINSWLPMNIGEQVTAERMQQQPLVVLIESVCGVRIAEVQQTISATLATGESARMLRVRPRSALLVVKRVYFSSDGLPVDLAINYICPKRFEYQERLVRSGSGTGPG